MRLLNRILAFATSLLLAACIPVSVQNYTATDGSSFRRYASPLDCSRISGSSTVILDRPNVHVELDINGVWGPSNRLETAMVVEASPGTVVRLQGENVEVDSPDFPAPLGFTVMDPQVRGAVSTYRIWVS